MDVAQSPEWARSARTGHNRYPSPLAAEVLAGLSCPQKSIDPKFFYDERGSQLFEAITRLPEYYPTRTEIQILQQYAGEIAEYLEAGSVIVEPGAGSCEKIRYLLEDLRPAAYVPQDISDEFLQQTARHLRNLYPWLKVLPVTGDFGDGITLPEALPDGRRNAFYPGSTIGNLEPSQAAEFLKHLRQLVGEDGGLLLGVDLQKDTSVLNAAYNDSAGITAAFNLNVLKHINRITGAKLNPENFEHRAFYNTERHRIEMHLVSRDNQKILCGDVCLYFAEGETIHTESSYKYTVDGIEELANEAGFELIKTWVDDQQRFSVNYLR